jgi:hypothetical protein
MARPKKPVAKAKRTLATQSTARGRAKQQAHDKAKMSADIKTQTAQIKLLKGTSAKRPPNNPDMPQNVIDMLNTDFNSIKELLDNFSQHLRALDRMRLNGVGIKKLGFIERAYELALENGEFLPHYLTLERFGTDIQYFMDFRSLTDLVTQIREKLWNITIQSADIAYTDALEFYASVREAAKRRVDAAESIHNALSPFFRRHRSGTEEPTEKQALRDFKALEHGKHDGKLIIENEKPKLTGGKRKIIDETFKDKTQFKGSIEGEVDE